MTEAAATAGSSAATETFVTVQGLRTRYLAQGDGPPAILVHGASLGSSADVWRRNLGPLAAHGVRAIAYDQPGFGMSDDPPDWGLGFRTSFILAFMDALGLDGAALVGHSQAGAMAVRLALTHGERVSRVVVLGTGSLLPPLPDKEGSKSGPAEGEEGGDAEPTVADARALLEANLFDHALITDDEVALRLRMSTGKNFRAFQARKSAGAAGRAGGGQKDKPLWQRLGEIRQPLLMIYGRDDRGEAARRVELARREIPDLDLHVVPACKHLVQWDAADAFHRLAGPFLREADTAAVRGAA
ncbi:MAG TPA: alpha/beta hydrolase [Beijerinckiaceae bacterium]|nr:alpha/beta hydrolase [Beijerinckiaceae bacterium]